LFLILGGLCSKSRYETVELCYLIIKKCSPWTVPCRSLRNEFKVSFEMQGVEEKCFLPPIEKRKRKPMDIQLVGRTEENRLPGFLFIYLLFV